MTSEDDPDADAPTGVAPTELAVPIGDTEAVTAWSLDDSEEWNPPRRLTAGRITGIAVAASLTTAAATGTAAVIYLRSDKSAPISPPTAAPDTLKPPDLPSPTKPSSPVPVVTPGQPEIQGADAKFIAEMRGFGVPISDKDPQWTVDMAHAICETVREGQPNRYPPGTHTVGVLTEGVMTTNPDWTRQQATRLTIGAINHYCPEVRGANRAEIAALPPDNRFLAILQDQLGITPVDDSLVRAAHQVCIWKQQGWWNDKIVDAMNGPSPRQDEQVIVETAIAIYCPQLGP